MKKVLFLFSVLIFAVAANAQFGINVGISALKFTGDVGEKSNSNFFSDSRLGCNIGVDYRIGQILGINLNGMFGNLQGTDNSIDSHRNFTSNIFGGELNVFAFFDKIGGKEREVAPFISAGLGFMVFDPFGDLRNGNGTSYVYWSDGSIRNLTESVANDPLATVLKRDYKYETQLTDSAANYSRSCLYLPINVGAKFQIGFRTSLRISVNYNIAFSDYIDNYKSGGNDSWLGANASINVHLGKKPKDIYSDIDFTELDHSDYDKDGVQDVSDRCLGTPAGVKVDTHGCPLDEDNDEVPDYLDKEANSKRGAKVDGAGVTINEEDVAHRQLEWDSTAVERSEGFNTMPSLSYLKQVEAKGKEIKEKSGKTITIPKELKGADLNNDGHITATEITKTIDAFFEGDAGFTVERINRLIDFFFEQ